MRSDAGWRVIAQRPRGRLLGGRLLDRVDRPLRLPVRPRTVRLRERAGEGVDSADPSTGVRAPAPWRAGGTRRVGEDDAVVGPHPGTASGKAAACRAAARRRAPARPAPSSRPSLPCCAGPTCRPCYSQQNGRPLVASGRPPTPALRPRTRTHVRAVSHRAYATTRARRVRVRAHPLLLGLATDATAARAGSDLDRARLRETLIPALSFAREASGAGRRRDGRRKNDAQWTWGLPRLTCADRASSPARRGTVRRRVPRREAREPGHARLARRHRAARRRPRGPSVSRCGAG